MAHRVRTKVCGITTLAEARAAVAAGADAIGLVFAERSARRLSVVEAATIARAVPPFVARVALFMDDDAHSIGQVLKNVPIDTIQFHGRETPEYCRGFGRSYIKAVPMGEPGIELSQWAANYHDAAGLLLDANRAGQAGGSGETFDWQQEVESVEHPIIVAGGLHADNVGQAITRFAPYAVDVSSGVEQERGVKSNAKMKAFIDAVTQAGHV